MDWINPADLAAHDETRRLEEPVASGDLRKREGQKPGFSIATEQLGDGQRIVAVEGELDMLTAPRLEAELLRAIDAGASRLILDLTGCDYLDSTTLSVLIRVGSGLNGTGPFVLVVPRPHVLKVFEMTSLDGQFAIYPTRAEALSTRPATEQSEPY